MPQSPKYIRFLIRKVYFPKNSFFTKGNFRSKYLYLTILLTVNYKIIYGLK